MSKPVSYTHEQLVSDQRANSCCAAMHVNTSNRCGWNVRIPNALVTSRLKKERSQAREPTSPAWSIYEKSASSIRLNDKRLNAFPFNQKNDLFPHLIKHRIVGPVTAIRQEKKGAKTEKKESDYIHSQDMIRYAGNPKEYTKTLFCLINTCIRFLDPKAQQSYFHALAMKLI